MQCAELLKDAPRLRSFKAVRGLLQAALDRLELHGFARPELRERAVKAKSWCRMGLDTPALDAAKLYAGAAAWEIEQIARALWDDWHEQ